MGLVRNRHSAGGVYEGFASPSFQRNSPDIKDARCKTSFLPYFPAEFRGLLLEAREVGVSSD